MRSLLFVPGDRPDRFAKAASSSADALILDLEDSLTPDRKQAGREAVTDYLKQPRSLPLIVRIDPEHQDEDLAAILPHRPDAIMLPKAEGAASVAALALKLGGIKILPIATETARAVFQLGTYSDVSAHLIGLTWGAEDLPAAIGAATSREADGRFTAPYEILRAFTLFAAHAANTAAIETVYPDFRDEAGLVAYAGRAKREGFTGMMAIHPAQVPIINAAFTPSAADLAWAKAVVAAFAANPGAGALQLQGRMIDAPHLKAAQRLLASA
jgi:citrate lyase subunit beta/citryl-CoA lyase